MKSNNKIIENEWLVRPTGDPFADAGGFAIGYLSEKFPDKDILEMIDYITKIYVEKWDGKLHAFFLNSKVTQAAFQGQRKIDETNKYFKGIIEGTEPSEVGYCRITGQETRLFFGGRDNSIMTGSGTLINFHHFFQKGIALSKEALIRIHFVPFACQQLQGKISLLQSSNEALSRLFVKLTIDKNFHEIGLGLGDGVTRSDCNKPANAIFDFVEHALWQIHDFKNGSNLPSLTLYHFTNFGASPEIQLYQLPAKVFIFYWTCMQPKYEEDWKKFVRSHYFDAHHKGAKYNINTGKIEVVLDKKSAIIDQNDYKQWFNRILNKLLLNENIRPEILRWSRIYPFNFEIVSNYQQNIIGMKRETITKIKELAAFLVREEDADKIKKRINALDGAKNASSLRRFILKDVVVANYYSGNDDPIVSVDDYVDCLFPDGNYWREIRDILLIAIYQELHKRNLISEDLQIELEEEVINE